MHATDASIRRPGDKFPFARRTEPTHRLSRDRPANSTMTRYAMQLAIAASLRVARKSAAPLGVDVTAHIAGCGQSNGDARRIDAMLEASDEQFNEACSRAAALGEFKGAYSLHTLPSKRGGH